jgi:hypothetical protein
MSDRKLSPAAVLKLAQAFYLTETVKTISGEAREDRTLRELQTTLPWTAHYHRDFRASPQTHKDFGHALLHIHKAGGKLAAILDEAEHSGFDWADPSKRAEVGKYVADMVICALRMATTCPDGQLDLQRLVEDRLTAKNNQLAAVAPVLAAGERA